MDSRKLYKRLTALGLTGAIALSGAFLVAPWEGKENRTYADVVGIPTACYGETGTIAGKKVSFGSVYTDEECEIALAESLVKHDKQLQSVVKVKYKSDYQHAALLSFTYNVGIGNVKSSTLIKLLNQGKHEEACAQLSRWVYAQKKKFNGLVRRREEERRWCMGEVSKEVRDVHEANK